MWLLSSKPQWDKEWKAREKKSFLSNYIIYVCNYHGYAHSIPCLFLLYVHLFRGSTILAESTYFIKPVIGMLNFKMSEVQTGGSVAIKGEDIWKWLKK